jgi:raffinose/stachyose/melibiose transport system substrate-binding protein
MMKKVVLAVCLLMMLVVGVAQAQDTVTLTIESWRNDDLTIWEDKILPVFEAQYPNIDVVFAPTAPTEYNAALNTKLEGGTAGDLITCRPFDASLALFQQDYLASLNDLPGMDQFGDVAKSAWITDDGSDVFCVPMASVIHGFIYNADIFAELGLEEPTTLSEFYAVLDAIAADGNYTPLVMGTADQWESATMGYQNIGPNFWMGETGRLGLIDGSAQYNTGGFLAAFEELANWAPYLGEGYQAQSYPDSQNVFSLGLGAIYPSGSWDISVFRGTAEFELGAFKPPVPDGQAECFISDHTDIAMGMNAATEHSEEARIFLEWMTTAEFASLYSNALPGFFSLSNHTFELEDPVAAEFVGWRQECSSTIRSGYQILSRGEPNNETQLWEASAAVLNGSMSPQEAADMVQEGLEAWYEPQQGS